MTAQRAIERALGQLHNLSQSARWTPRQFDSYLRYQLEVNTSTWNRRMSMPLLRTSRRGLRPIESGRPGTPCSLSESGNLRSETAQATRRSRGEPPRPKRKN
jgi:hypothetical protein